MLGFKTAALTRATESAAETSFLCLKVSSAPGIVCDTMLGCWKFGPTEGQLVCLLLIEFHHHPAPRITANSKRQVSGDTVLALTALTNTIPYWKKEIPQTWCCFTHFLFYSPQQTVRTRPSLGSSDYFLAQVHSPCYAHDGSVDT